MFDRSNYFHPKSLQHLRKAVCKTSLGHGGFATVNVYQCAEHHSGQPEKLCNECYIVKRLSLEDALFVNTEDITTKEKLLTKMLHNEYVVGISLQHENIIKTVDIDELSNCLILENFVGIDLLDFMNLKEPRQVMKQMEWFKQVLNAVCYLHERGVAHMDLKLENIVLNRETDVIKLIDFGQAKVFKKKGEYKYGRGICGTEGYFAPELYTDDSYMPDKIDAWCCGVVLHNLLFDGMPWEAADSKQDAKYKLFKTNMMPKNKAMYSTEMMESIQKLGFCVQDSFVIRRVLLGLLNPDPMQRMSVEAARDAFRYCLLMTSKFLAA